MEQCQIVKRYPQFLSHIKSLWPRRKEWAHCFQRRILLQGNNTTNYSEASMKIIKDLIFDRIKAYNFVQEFHFLSDTLESYYCRKLLSVSNNHSDCFIAIQFEGLCSVKFPKKSIKEVDKNKFSVRSKIERSVLYTVDEMGVCTCPRGIDGSLCSHQATISTHYKTASINCIPTLSPTVCQVYAKIALCEKADLNIRFYANLHDQGISIAEKKKHTCFNITYPSMDLIQSEANVQESDANMSDDKCDLQRKIQDMCLAIDKIAEDLKQKLMKKKEQLLFGVEKFSSSYEKLKSSIPLLKSSLHPFGWMSSGSISSFKGGQFRHGKRINIQATAAGRKNSGKSRGKTKAIQGWMPAGSCMLASISAVFTDMALIDFLVGKMYLPAVLLTYKKINERTAATFVGTQY